MAAVLIQPFKISVGIVLQNIKKAQDLMILDVRLLKEGIQMITRAILGAGIQNSAVCKELIDLVIVERITPICCMNVEKLIQAQLIVNVLKIKVANVLQRRAGGVIGSLVNFFVEINRDLNRLFSLPGIFIHPGDQLLAVSNGIISNLEKLRMLAQLFHILGS